MELTEKNLHSEVKRHYLEMVTNVLFKFNNCFKIVKKRHENFFSRKKREIKIFITFQNVRVYSFISK